MRTTRFLILGLALVLSSPMDGPAAAQSCSADVNCQSGLLSNNTCVGDTLVVRRRLCVGGQCQETEQMRQSCGLGGAGSCSGNVYVRNAGRCDALAGRCVQRLEQDVCVKSCTSRGNVLTVSTGLCVPGLGCDGATLRCPGGCTCSPEPACLGGPAPKRK